jgi:hypothetical protein
MAHQATNEQETQRAQRTPENPLSNQASSCHKLLVVTNSRRISNRHNGAASIAPNNGLTTSPRRERKLAAAPGRVKKSKPSSGWPEALNAPFTLKAKDRQTAVNSKKQLITPAQFRLMFKLSS